VEPHDEESCCGECLTPLMDEAFEKAVNYNPMNPKNADFVMGFKLGKYFESPGYKDFMKSLLRMTVKNGGKVDIIIYITHKQSVTTKNEKLISTEEACEMIDDICNTADKMDDESRQFILEDYAENF
jgi:hypothetical protein